MEKFLTPEQRISAMAAAAEAINEIRAHYLLRKAEGKVHYSVSLTSRNDFENFDVTLFAIVFGDKTAVAIGNCPYLHTGGICDPITPENIKKAIAWTCDKIDDIVFNYPDYVAKYQEELKEKEEAE